MLDPITLRSFGIFFVFLSEFQKILPRPLQHLVGGEAPHQHAVVVPGQPDVDVAGGEVGVVLLEDGLVADGLGWSVQEQAGAVVPAAEQVSLIKFDTRLGSDYLKCN